MLRRRSLSAQTPQISGLCSDADSLDFRASKTWPRRGVRSAGSVHGNWIGSWAFRWDEEIRGGDSDFEFREEREKSQPFCSDTKLKKKMREEFSIHRKWEKNSQYIHWNLLKKIITFYRAEWTHKIRNRILNIEIYSNLQSLNLMIYSNPLIYPERLESNQITYFYIIPIIHALNGWWICSTAGRLVSRATGSVVAACKFV